MIRVRSPWLLLLFLIAGAAVPGFFSTRTQGSDDQVARILYLNNRGVALLDQYKFKEAAAEFRRILELAPNLLAAHVNLGIAHFYDQKYPEAQAALRQALELSPNEIHAHYVMGLIYRNLDEPENAIAAFEAVNRQDSRDTSTNYYLGTLYMRQRDYAKAASFFQQVIEQEPYNASAHYNLAMAYNRSGQREAGQQSMREFQRLQELFGSTTVGLQYLEQGQYAIAIDSIPESDLPGSREPVSSGLPVSFAQLGDSSGVTFRHGGPGDSALKAASAEQAEQELVPYMGSGLAFQDFDGDGWLDLYLANASRDNARGALYRNRGDGTFEEVTESAGLTHAGKTLHAFWGDYDSDGLPDLYLVNYGPNVLYRNLGNGRFQDVTAATATGDANWGIGGGFVDYDHDGDLDLYVLNFSTRVGPFSGERRFPADFPGAPNVLYRNNGDETFTDVSGPSGLAGGAEQTLSFLSSDLDNTRDVDFLIINRGAPNRLMNNVRDGSFRQVDADLLSRAGALSVNAADLDRDGLMDVAVPSRDHLWLRNQGRNRFDSPDRPPVRIDGPVLSSQFLDFDNDGDMDLLVLVAPYLEPSGLTRGRNLYLLENRGGELVDVSAAAGLAGVAGHAVRGAAVADWDNDGDLDFAVTVNGGKPLLFRNDGGNRNNWLAIVPAGTNSNRPGLGVKAEIRAGALWQRQESFGAQGFLAQNSPVLHFGLGRHQQADVVRLLWPNGVLQSEIDRAANQRIRIEELDRKGTSCPILYVWDGNTYRFQTDFLGGSAYGSLLAPGVFNYPDTDEYIKLNRHDVALKDGRLEISMNNQLEEVLLFDRLELLVVDHPAGYEVFPDEKLLPGPPYQPFRLLTAEGARPPVAALDWAGRDIRPQLVHQDRVYAPLPGLLPFKGYAEDHSFVLDLGETNSDYTVLLMHAWIDYADSSSNLAASQAGVQLVPPYLQVQNPAGEWVTVMERMGFPAGLPKTMTVDLSGRFLSDSRKVRIVTNMRIYWDQVLVATGRPRDDYRIHRVEGTSADLGYRGFPLFHSPDGRMPKVYDYGRSMPAEWKVHVGAYTRFGDVLPLLSQRDDRFVITRSGDEIRASFDLTGLPELPSGWTRDYLVYVDGFGKDMDPNSAGPEFLGPLPFHGMTSYPYPESERYLRTPGLREYLEQWNTRVYEKAVPPLESRRTE